MLREADSESAQVVGLSYAFLWVDMAGAVFSTAALGELAPLRI